MKGVKGVPKKKKDKEVQAQRTAGHIAEAEKAAADADAQVVAEYDVTTWDYVSSKAITEEHMRRCSSACRRSDRVGGCRRLRAGRGAGQLLISRA